MSGFNDLVHKAFNEFSKKSAIQRQLNRKVEVTQEEYDKLVSMDRMPTKLVKKLDINKLDEIEILYLLWADLLEPYWRNAADARNTRPDGYRWANNSRRAFWLHQLKIVAKKSEIDYSNGEMFSFNFPPHDV